MASIQTDAHRGLFPMLMHCSCDICRGSINGRCDKQKFVELQLTAHSRSFSEPKCNGREQYEL
jgi:hypothetical protein